MPDSYFSAKEAMLNSTSERLKQNSKKIMKLWETRTREELSASIHQDSLALQNSLPRYLNHLADDLCDQPGKTSAQIETIRLESTHVGKQHGHERAGYADYTVSQLILEYHILRQVIFQVLEEQDPLDVRDRDIIIDSIEQAVNDAATQFSHTLRDIQEMFMVTLTHDLRGPVNVVKMGAQLILRRFERGDAHLDITVRMIGAIDRMDAMIQNLLDASRLRAGQSLTLDFEECNLDQLLRESVEDLAFIYGERFVVVSDPSITSSCSRKQIRRVIENLASNAVKYGEPDTPITFILQRDNGWIHLTIHNQGTPIPPETQSILFQQFRRTPAAEEKTGWGLGLFLAKNIVEAHRGTIDIESAEGKGTSFIIKLPE
ncbi:MAG: HAMP domain-containing histidine kinase [Tildeniella torsiva UHER 1998/13D]|jgi:signal transduction histidine kinase|nr:HAMP domain-containing histidine kinase [Tildeniella torsiva UHER 1998/13D]